MLSCHLNLAQAEEEHKLNDVTTTEPVITTTLPEDVTEAQATATPEEKLLELDQALALEKVAAAEPATTTPPLVPPTTKEPQKPHAHPPNPHPYPYPYGLGYNPLSPRAESEPKPKTSAAEYPEYPYLGYPILRSPYSPYSPYGSPLYHRHAPLPQFPGLSTGQDYGHPPSPGGDNDEESKSDETEEEDEKKTPAQHASPSFGFPPLYVIQRRPLFPSYGYSGPARGYGMPFAYGR